MADVNNVVFTGRLTRDAEKKTLPTGTNLVTFDIANNTGWGDYAKTIYLTCNLWGKQGDNIFKYLLKGQMVAVTGALEVQEWTSAQDGQQKRKNVVNCRGDVVLISSAKHDDAPQPREPHYDNGHHHDEGNEEITY